MLVLVTGVLVIGILAILMWFHRRDLEKRWTLAGGDADGARGSRERIGWEVGYIFMVLALFVIGMIQLLLHIRW